MSDSTRDYGEPDDPLIDRAVDYFEKKYAADKSYRIENLLDEWEQVDRKTDSPPDEVFAELICVEMDLRWRDEEELDIFEIIRRFPGHLDIIEESWNRLLDLTIGNEFDRQGNFPANLVSVELIEQDDSEEQHLVVGKKGSTEVPENLGDYKNLELIGEGGFGIVYRAFDSKSNRQVALKFPKKIHDSGREVDAELLNMISTEADRVMELRHEGIVETIGIETIDQFVFVVQEFVEGEELKSWMWLPRSYEQIAELIASIADALACAHTRGIVHRDLKPGNVLLDAAMNPKIADFGLAFHDSEQIDLPDRICGTPAYMSPQQADGHTGILDGRTDIWSLGVILYELLTGQKPFVGKSRKDIFNQIQTRDPKPPRQVVPEVDPKLEWICLKCLAYQARDRFQVAGDLAKELRDWIASRNSDAEQGSMDESDAAALINPNAKFVPKGLRAYGPEDADSFMQLLPGIRDHKGVPASIRFWQSRIREPIAEENRIPIGVIYGPSGCGKSSFVKAGLLPSLGESVCSIYVESTKDDTEVRIIKQLRRRFPQIPDDASLPRIFAGISEGRWGAGKQKILLVLDQFEQRLSVAEPYGRTQIAKALKYVDGHQLQCLLLIRDDFWLGLSRFADALEMDLQEGHNCQNIDLFDQDHARKVLTMMGQAYGRLPEEIPFDDLEPKQKKFVEFTVDQLSVSNYVICVRMALFAEMFKDRPWTPEELKRVGGVQGIGETFLESTFGKDSLSKKYKLQKDAVQAILSELLPDSGADIRGSMKTEASLRKAAGLDSKAHQFNEAIKSLDQELRLITRTSPDESGVDERPLSESTEQSLEHSQSKLRHYQLTHDYLVPSIRNWIKKWESATPKGRIKSQIGELASNWDREKDDRFLPTLSEFLMASFRLKGGELNASEKRLIRRTRAYYLVRLVLVLIVVALIGGAWFS